MAGQAAECAVQGSFWRGILCGWYPAGMERAQYEITTANEWKLVEIEGRREWKGLSDWYWIGANTKGRLPDRQSVCDGITNQRQFICASDGFFFATEGRLRPDLGEGGGVLGVGCSIPRATYLTTVRHMHMHECCSICLVYLSLMPIICKA